VLCAEVVSSRGARRGRRVCEGWVEEDSAVRQAPRGERTPLSRDPLRESLLSRRWASTHRRPQQKPGEQCGLVGMSCRPLCTIRIVNGLSAAEPTTAESHGPGRLARWINRVTAGSSTPWIFVPIVLLRLILVATYPLNFLKADGSHYYDMLVGGFSDLSLAPGYPFLIGLPWRTAIGSAFVDAHPIVFHYLLCATQHAINVTCLLLAYWVVVDLYGRLAANLFALLYGLHFQVLSVTSSLCPEWFQGSLVMLMIFLLHRAWHASKLQRRALLWVLAGSVAAWCYLVKFNAVALVGLPLLVAVAELRRRRGSALVLAAALLAAIVNYAAFVVCFHKPHTGTYAVNMAKACLLLQRVQLFLNKNTMSPDTGINTKRLLVLNALLPSPDHFRRSIWRLDWVPESERAPYRERYGYLLTADEATLDTAARGLDLSRPFNFGRAYLPVSYYIDFPAGHRLGVAVFFEHVRAYPGAYARSVWKLTWYALTRPRVLWLYPLNVDSSWGRPLGWGFIEMTHTPGEHEGYRFREPFIWLPGARFLTLHHRLYQWPPVLVSITVLFGVLRMLWLWLRRHQLGVSSVCYLVGTAGAFGFVVFSNVVLHFRWKEVHPIMPIVCILCAVSLAWAIRAMASPARRWLASRQDSSDQERSPAQGHS
jgi:hypothetical protein